MHSDAMRARKFADSGGRDRIRFIGAPGLANCGDVIDVYRKKRHEYLPITAFHRILMRSKNMRVPSRKKLTLLPSAWLQRTGVSRILRPCLFATNRSSASKPKPEVVCIRKTG